MQFPVPEIKTRIHFKIKKLIKSVLVVILKYLTRSLNANKHYLKTWKYNKWNSEWILGVN